MGDMALLRETAGQKLGAKLPQPTTGYERNVTPRGPVVRPEDAFPESCCEGGPLKDKT